MSLKEKEKVKTKKKFPDKFTINEKLYSPLSVLHYNLTFRFLDDYPAKMPEDFARDMILLYSNKGDLVWDGCCGSGTVPRVAFSLERVGYGSDINPKAIDLCKAHDEEYADYYQVKDCREMTFDVKPKMILSSLPFGLNIIGNKNNYSNESLDISNSPDYETFFDSSKRLIQSYFANLAPGGVCILDARDRLHKGKTIPLILNFLYQALECGFELVTRFYYDLIPYRQMTYKHKPSGYIKAMPATMDVIVLTKLEDQKLG